jgi:hypothetical protein
VLGRVALFFFAVLLFFLVAFALGRVALGLTGLASADRARLVTLLSGVAEESPDFDENAPLPLTATCRGRASFPTAVVTDARRLGGGLGGSTRDLWATLNLQGMNRWLAQPLTRKEVKANLSSSPDLAGLPTFPVRFVPSPVGSAPSAVVLQLFNPGFLATQFEIHFPNERDVEVPQWADEVRARWRPQLAPPPPPPSPCERACSPLSLC